MGDPPLGVVLVPPEQLDSWTDEDFASYKIWMSNKTSKNSKKDYIDYCTKINKDFHMDKIYDDIKIGLSSLERFVEFSKLFPSFDNWIW